MEAAPEDRTCATCGRRIEPRRRWSSRGDGAWAAVRHCSAACRRRRRSPLDARLEDAFLALLAARPAAASICPSEAARQVDPAAWRQLLERARAASRRLVAAGRLEMTQGGRVVDPSHARGAIRLRLRRSP